jgi:Dienelactone hydrolase family
LVSRFRLSPSPYGLKGVRKPLAQIAGELNVDAVVEGSVLRSGNQVRITAQLIQASADKHIWAQSYEGEIRDTLVLQNLARAGADLAGVVTFHAALNTPRPEDAKNIMGKALVLHGADDPLAPDAEVLTFEKEMRDATVDWQLISYGNTVHSFTNWDLDSDHSKPLPTMRSPTHDLGPQCARSLRRFRRPEPPVIWIKSSIPVLNAAILILSVHFPLRPSQFSCLKAGLGHGPRRPAEPLRPAPCGHRADAR